MTVTTLLSSETLLNLELSAEKDKIRRRLQIVRLALEGRTGSSIADQVGLSRRRVQNWVSRFNQLGLIGLMDGTLNLSSNQTKTKRLKGI